MHLNFYLLARTMAKVRRFLSLKQSLPTKEAEALWIQAAYSDESFGMRAGVQTLLVEKTLALHAHPEINGTELLEKVRKWEVSYCMKFYMQIDLNS